MRTALVTGANKGIGFEVAKQLAQLGYYVYLGCRDVHFGKLAIDKLNELGITNVEVVHIDITNADSINDARKTIESRSTHLDILINNAGILGSIPQPAETFSVEEIRRIFDTNFFGTIQVTQTFIPLLKESPGGRIINVSSELGSLTLHNDLTWKYYPFKSAGYSVSKTALNSYTIMLAFGLKDTNIKVNAVNPGYTATDFNSYRGERTPEQAGSVIVKYATSEDGASGKFFTEEGEMPW
jgi:NAD(P)-dependent dehydrogenase (short-subunit alcohol dehydrogenase family)